MEQKSGLDGAAFNNELDAKAREARVLDDKANKFHTTQEKAAQSAKFQERFKATTDNLLAEERAKLEELTIREKARVTSEAEYARMQQEQDAADAAYESTPSYQAKEAALDAAMRGDKPANTDVEKAA